MERRKAGVVKVEGGRSPSMTRSERHDGGGVRGEVDGGMRMLKPAVTSRMADSGESPTGGKIFDDGGGVDGDDVTVAAGAEGGGAEVEIGNPEAIDVASGGNGGDDVGDGLSGFREDDEVDSAVVKGEGAVE